MKNPSGPPNGKPLEAGFPPPPQPIRLPRFLNGLGGRQGWARSLPRRVVLRAATAFFCGLAGFAAHPALGAKPCPAYKSFCLSADQSGWLDLKSGVASLEGNVTGVVVKLNLTVKAQVLKATYTQKEDILRFLMDREVEITQPGRQAKADHAVVEYKTGVIILFGNASLAEGPLWIEADEVRAETNPNRHTVSGTDAVPLFIRYQAVSSFSPDAALNPAPAPGHTPFTPPDLPGENPLSGEEADTGLPQASREPAEGAKLRQPQDTYLLRAGKAEVEKNTRAILLTGNVTVERVELGWTIQGQKIELHFTPARKLARFEAEGSVVIQQPGRVVKADAARSGKNLQTILLSGNAAVMQEGRFDLASDRIEVYADVDKGIVTGGQKSVTLTIDPKALAPYKLDEEKLTRLAALNVPPATLAKLKPLSGRVFDGRPMFTNALQEVLSPEEANQYMEIIIANGR